MRSEVCVVIRRPVIRFMWQWDMIVDERQGQMHLKEPTWHRGRCNCLLRAIVGRVRGPLGHERRRVTFEWRGTAARDKLGRN